MPDRTSKHPSEVATEKLRANVMADATLLSAIKAAFLADIDSPNPAALSNLKSALAAQDPPS